VNRPLSYFLNLPSQSAFPVGSLRCPRSFCTPPPRFSCKERDFSPPPAAIYVWLSWRHRGILTRCSFFTKLHFPFFVLLLKDEDIYVTFFVKFAPAARNGTLPAFSPSETSSPRPKWLRHFFEKYRTSMWTCFPGFFLPSFYDFFRGLERFLRWSFFDCFCPVLFNSGISAWSQAGPVRRFGLLRFFFFSAPTHSATVIRRKIKNPLSVP